jgi:hypothetical protein
MARPPTRPGHPGTEGHAHDPLQYMPGTGNGVSAKSDQLASIQAGMLHTGTACAALLSVLLVLVSQHLPGQPAEADQPPHPLPAQSSHLPPVVHGVVLPGQLQPHSWPGCWAMCSWWLWVDQAAALVVSGQVLALFSGYL